MMKKLLYIVFFLFTANLLVGQTVDTTLRFDVDIKRKSIFVQTPDQYFVFDTLRSYTRSGAILTSLHSGVWTAENLGIIPGSTNWLSRLAAACNRLYVKEIRFTSDSSRVFQFTGKLNAMGVVFSFENGCYLRGSGSTDTLINARLRGGVRDKIIDNIRLADGIVSETGEFSFMWNGASPDSTSTSNMFRMKRWVDFGSYRTDKGLHTKFKIPAGEWWMKRTGSPGTMINPTSNTHWVGEGPNTILKLDTAARINFSRFFYIGTGVTNVEIGNLSFDGSNHIPTYDSVKYYLVSPEGDTSYDAQGNFIFTYSSDSTRPTEGHWFHDLTGENCIGDAWGISRNSRNIILERIRQGGNIRQNVGIGGGFVDGLWIRHVTDIKGKTYVAKKSGGNSIHSEPYDPLYNIHISDCIVNDVSVGGIYSGSMTRVTTLDSSIFTTLSYVGKMSVSSCTFAGRLQITPAVRADINVINNNLNSVYITTVAGYQSKRGALVFAYNNIVPKDSVIGIQGGNVDSVTLEHNHIFTRYASAIQMSNIRSHRIVDNEATVRGTGNFANIRVYNSTTGTYGNGVGFINGNYGYGPYRFIAIENRSDIIGPNNQGSAPTPLYLTGAKIFPYRDGSGRQVLNTATFPNYHVWKKGDIINILDGDFGDPTNYVIASDGALVGGTWTSGGTYYINNFVRDTATIASVLTTRYFRSKTSGGQAEKPMDDVDNTYWEQVATTEATYWSNSPNGSLIYGVGVPEGVFAAKHGVIYINKSGDSCTTAYIKTVEGGTTGWRSLSCGGFGGGGGVSAPILTSTTFGDFTGAQRLSADGNTVFDIMDANTGEYFSATKATHYKGVTITDTDLDSIIFFKKDADFFVRNFNTLTVDMCGAVPDYNRNTLTGTDNTPYFQKAVNLSMKLGGVEIFGNGNYLVDSTVYINSPLQTPFKLYGPTSNVSYAEGDTIPKGLVIYRKKSGAIFKTNLNQSNRYFHQASYTYKSVSFANISFYGVGVTYGIRAIESFRTRIIADNLCSYKIDYLAYQPDSDGFGNDSYCDAGVWRNCKVYSSRRGGLRLYKNDAGLVENLTMEVGTDSTRSLLELKAGSSTTVQGVILGNKGNGQLITGSSLISLDNCTNNKLRELHIERCYMENVFDLRNNTRGTEVDGLYTKFEMNNGFNFSFDVRNTLIQRWFTLATPANGYYDLKSNSLNIEGVRIEAADFRDDAQTVREMTTSGTFNSSVLVDKNNFMTTSKFNAVGAVNELKYNMNYIQAQRALSGGGVVSYTADSALKWSAQFIARMVDRNITTSTFMRIFMPNAGDTIKGLGTTPSVIVGSNGIKLATDNFLIWVHKTKLNADSGQLYIANRNNFSANQLPLNSLLIANKNSDDGSLNLGTGHVMIPGSIVVEGRLIYKDVIQAATNVNTTVNNRTTLMILNEGGNNGLQRTLTLKADTAFTGTSLWIVNYNSSATKWLFNESVKDYSNNNVDTIQNQTTYHLKSRGTYWLVLGTYSNVVSGGGGGSVIVDAVPTNGSNNAVSSDGVFDALATKQNTLVSNSNIKTVGGNSLIGPGDIPWPSGTGTVNAGVQYRLAYYPNNGTTVDDHTAILANRALISNANGLPTHSSITSTELAYLAGLTGNVRDSLIALRAAIETNVTIGYTFWRDGDSIRIDFNGQAYAVYAPVGGGSFTEGSVTPVNTGTNVNVASISTRTANYQIIGNTVHVWGMIQFTPSSATPETATYFKFEPPVTSLFSTISDGNGAGAAIDAANNVRAVAIRSDPTTEAIHFQLQSGSNSLHTITYKYSYKLVLD